MSRDTRQVVWMMVAAVVVCGCIWYQTSTHPPPPDLEVKALCWHQGRQSSHNAHVRLPAGLMRCDNGRWTPVARP